MGRVGFAHIEEALAGVGDSGEAGLVWACGGVGAGEVDVVADADQGSGSPDGVDAAGGVGDDEGLAAEQAEDAGGKGDFGEGATFVEVRAALQDGDWLSGDGTEKEMSGVAGDGWPGKVGDFLVRDDGGVCDL